jgi:hypothetical protein
MSTTAPAPLSFIDAFALADCAARIFAEERTSRNKEGWAVKGRQMLREPATRALRHLWRTGSVDQRVTVATRVAIWMKRPAQETQIRIKRRETARLATA